MKNIRKSQKYPKKWKNPKKCIKIQNLPKTSKYPPYIGSAGVSVLTQVNPLSDNTDPAILSLLHPESSTFRELGQNILIKEENPYLLNPGRVVGVINSIVYFSI